MRPQQGTIIEQASDTGGWSAEMRAATFVLHAPRGADGAVEHRFVRAGAAWSVDLGQIAPLLAVLRDAMRWFRTVWEFDPTAGRVFGMSSGLTTRREHGRLHLQAQRWSAWASSTGRLQLPYTDLHILRQRLQEQQQAVRRANRRKASHHGIYTHQ